MTIKSFKNKETEEIGNGRKTKLTLKRLPSDLHYNAYKKLIFLDSISEIKSLYAFPGWRLKPLKGDRKSLWSIRINDQYRICFRFDSGDVFDVEIVDYH